MQALAGIVDKSNGPFYAKVMALVLRLMEVEEAAVRDEVVKACPALMAKGDVRAIRTLLQAAHAHAPGTRQAALQVLPRVSALDNPDVMSAVLLRMRDSDWAVRREAACACRVLASAMDERVMTGLSFLLEDPEAHVREAAKQSLAALRKAERDAMLA